MSILLKIQIQGELESSQNKASLKNTYNLEKDWKKKLLSPLAPKLKLVEAKDIYQINW